MIYTIVPASNEEKSIGNTLRMIAKTKTDKILVILNGCTDNSLEVIGEIEDERIEIIYFNKPLGLDVPRAIGAFFAYLDGGSSFIFVDGDMSGNISANIDKIIFDVTYNGVDMALTNCYLYDIKENSIAKKLLAYRKQFNIELGIYNTIGYSIPSHGPHGVSKRLLDRIGIKSLAIPPVALSKAVMNNLNIKISTYIPNNALESTTKDEFHAKQIVRTIIGDCIEALHIYRGMPPRRGFDDINFLGYHKNRRFDILDMIINTEQRRLKRLY